MTHIYYENIFLTSILSHLHCSTPPELNYKLIQFDILNHEES